MKKTQKKTKSSTLVLLSFLSGFFLRSAKKQDRDWDSLPAFLSIRETADLLNVHPNTLRLWDRQGKVLAVRLGSRRDRRYERGQVLALSASRNPQLQQQRRSLRSTVVSRLAVGFGVPAFVFAIVASSLFSLHAARADTATQQEIRLQPQTCSGWQYSQNATTIELPPVATAADFTSTNAATFHADQQAVTSSQQKDGVAIGTLDPNEGSAIVCSHFTADNFSGDAQLVQAQVTLSFSAHTAKNSTDAFFVEGSTNGNDWFPIAAFPNRDFATTYAVLPLDQLTDSAQFDTLSLRVRADASSFSPETVAALDGMAVVVTVSKSTEQQIVTSRGAQKKLDALVSFSQDVYQSQEQPIVTLPKKRPKKLLFFTRGYDAWSLHSVVLTDAQGIVTKSEYKTQDVESGQSTDTNIAINTASLHPGRYTVAVTMDAPGGTTETVQKHFVWGVIAMNVTEASPRPYDTEEVHVGVLDDGGRTVCNADVVLTVTDPKGKTTRLTTRDKTMTTNSACVDKGVTNFPDYAAKFVVNTTGLYRLHLEAKTAFGTRTTDQNFTVDDANSFVIHRFDFPTRINPTSSYPVRIAVIPLRGYAGTVTERVPADIQVSAFQPEAVNHSPADASHDQLISWQVDWQAGHTYFLSYTFDTPDVSPALFTLGSLFIGGDSVNGALFQETRQWQLASDSVAPQQEKKPTESQKQEKDRFLSLTAFQKTEYGTNEKPVLRIPKERKRQGLLAHGSDTWVVKSIAVRHPDGEVVQATSQTSDVASSADTDAELAIDTNAFHPGKNTVITDVVMPDGSEQSVENDVIWGVLVVNPEKSIYLPGETAQFAIAVLDYTGKTLCQADLKLTITSPGGVVTTLNTADDTIQKNYDCDVHSVSNLPDYAGQMVVTEVGTYALHLESTIKQGEARTGSDQTYSIDDSLVVQQNVPFDISRHDTATRLYPVVDYTAHLSVVANQDYQGTVSDFAPSSFRVYDISDGGVVVPSVNTDRQQINWQVDWHAGTTYTLSYTFDPPNPSPRLYPLGPLTVGSFQEARQWQLAADATRVWDGGDAGALWSTAANWDGNNALVSGDTVVFDGSAGGTPNDAATWDASAPGSIASLTISSYSGLLTVTGVASTATVTGAFSHTSTGGVTISSGSTLSVGGNFTLTTSGTVTTTGSTLSLTGTGSGNTLNSAATIEKIDYSPASSGTYTMSTNAPTVSKTLTVGANGTLTNNITTSDNCATTSQCLFIQNKGTANGLTLSGTISGTGSFVYQNSSSPAAVITFPATGTMSANIYFVPVVQNITVAGGTPRTFGGNVQARQPTAATTGRTVTFGSGASQTITISGNLSVDNESSSAITTTLTAATNSAAVNVSGNVNFLGTASTTGTEKITTGAGTWTVSGDFKPYNENDSDGSLTVTSGNTLVLNGTGKNFEVPSGATLRTLIISGTYTAITNGFTVANAMTIDANKSWTVDTVTMTMSTTSSLTLNGELDTTNAGLVDIRFNTSIGTGGTVNASIQFCPQGTTMAIPARSFTGTDKTLTFSSCSSSAGVTAQIAAGTFSVSGSVLINSLFAGALTMDFSTNNPTVNITGDFTNTTASNSVTTSMGSGTWTVGGNVDLSNTTTFNNNSGTLAMNGTSKTLTTAANSLYNFTVSGGSISTVGATTIANNLVVSAGTLTMGNAAHTVTGTSSITGTLNTGTGATGTRTFTGNVTVNSGGTWDLTGQNPAVSFAGDVTASSGATLFNNGTGGATWTASKQLAGAVNMTFGGTNTINAGVTLTNNNTGTVQFATINGGDGTSTLALSTGTANSYTKVTAAPMATGLILPSGSNASTFEYAYDTATVKVPTTNNYYHLILSSTGTVTMTSIAGTTGNLTLSGSNTVTTSTSTFTVGGNLTVGTGTTFHMGDVANTVTGTTSVTGTLDTATGSTGTRTFTGNVTINSGGTWDLTSQNPATSFAGDITVSSGATLFNNGTGGATWTATKQLAGAVNMTFGGTNTINSGITLTNNNSATVQFATIAGGDGTASLATGSGSTTKVSGAAMSTGTIVPSTSANTFEYNGATQTVKAPTTNPYYHLTLSGSGTVTMPGSGLTAISGNLTLSGTVSVTTASTLTVTLDIVVGTGTTFTINHDVTVNGGDITNAGTGSITTSSGTPTLTVAGTGSIGGVSGSTTFYNLTLSGTPTLASNIQVNNNLTLPSSVTAGTTTVTMTGTAGTLVGGGATLYALTIDPSSAGTITLNTSDLTVSNTLTVATADALTLNASRTLTLSGNSGTTLSLSGTINGPGRLTYQNSATTFPTGGTLASTLITRFDTVNGNLVVPARTDYGAIEAYGASANARTVTLGTAGSQTITTSSYFYVIADATLAGNNVTLQGATWDPTLNVGGDFDFTGTQAATEIVTAPDAAATWTVSGNVDLTAGTYTTSAETLVMNGSGKTLTSAGNTLFNVTLSGSITLADATHTVSGDLNMAGGTITAGTSTVSISGSGKTITGGSNTLYNLTLDGNGTTTLSTTGLTVSNTLNVTASDTLTLSAGLISTSAGTVTLGNSATLGGSSTLTVLNSNLSNNNSATLSAPVKFDATDLGTMTVPARTFGGAVTMTSGTSGGATTFVFGSSTGQTLTFSSDLTLTDAAPIGVALDAHTYDPTVSLTGDLLLTTVASSSYTIDMTAGTWTSSGAINLTRADTFNANGGTLIMNAGSSHTLTMNSKTFNNLTLSGVIALSGTGTVAGNLDMTGGTVSAGTSTLTMSGSGKTMYGGSNTLKNLTLDGDGTTTVTTAGFTVSGTLNVTALDTLSISSSLSVTSTSTLTLAGTISGAGTLIMTNGSSGPGSSGTLSSLVRFDATTANITSAVVDARTYAGGVELYDNSGSAHTIAFPTGTFAFSSYLTTTEAGAGSLSVDLDTGDPTVTVTGVVTIGANTTLSASATATLSVGDDFLNSGTFTANSGTVALTTTATATISGNTTFQTLSVSGIGAAKTIQFTAGSTTTVSGTWTVTGTSGNLVTLTSTTTSAWNINPTTASLDYVDISYANNQGAAICATHSQSTSGGNTGISVSSGTSCGITVSGVVRQTDESTAYDCSGDNLTIGVTVNGGTAATSSCTLNTGVFSVTTATSPSAAGDPVVVYIDSAETPKGTTVTLTADNSSNITNVDMYNGRVVLTHENAGPMTNAKMATGDNGDAGIRYAVSAGNLTVESGLELHVKAAKTFTAGGTVTTNATGGDFHIDDGGTATLDTATNSIGKDILVDTGSTVNLNASTDINGGDITTAGTGIVATSGTPTVTMISSGSIGGGSGAINFYNLSTSGTGTTTIASDAGVANTLTPGANTTISISSSKTLSNTGSAEVAWGASSIISGAGTLRFTDTSGGPATGGTLSSLVRFDATTANIASTTLDARTYAGAVELYSNAGTAKTITFPTGTFIFSSTLTATSAGGSTLGVDADTLDPDTTVTGAFTIGSNSTYTASSSGALNINGNYTNNGTFTNSSGTATLAGSAQQTLSGTLTGSSKFYNLTIMNASGSDPVSSPSVIFSGDATTQNTFTAATASTKLRFNASGTYTFQNINFNGTATNTRVALRSSSAGTQWNVNVAGTRTVSNTDVKDSTACGQSPTIDATDGTNLDSGNNSCWDINALTFTVDDNTIGFGTLTSANARYATGDTNGGTTASTPAHTLTVKTNATSGYAITYVGATLTDTNSHTVPVATISADADGAPASSQFAIAASTNGSGTVASGYEQASNNWKYIASTTSTLISKTSSALTTETVSLYYLCNISGTQVPGSYSTNITYVATGTF